MKEEINLLYERKVWELVDLPKGRKPIKGRWVFALKSDGRRKSHFVMKGFTQVFGIDYENTFSPVVRFETLRLLLSLAALHDWEIEALDVKTTFLFGELDEEIYMEQPEGFIEKGKEKKVCRLGKAIYGRLHCNGTSSCTKVSWRWDSPAASQTQELTSKSSEGRS